jgi:hypothetical protein
MIIECVVTCVNYGDFLAASLPFNRHVFDHLMVVTAPEDAHTQRVCEYHDVHCLVTDEFSRGGDAFNKGRGINAGLAGLKRTGWLVHMDADIVLPPKAREILLGVPLDPLTIYGIDRINCKSYLDWTRFLRLPALQHELDVFVHAGPFSVGTRIAKSEYQGYIPVGFFQLWCGPAFPDRRYPEHHGDAARGDMLFAVQWPRQRRQLLPELFAIHLESEPVAMGANWKGRTTRPFGPIPLLAASEGLEASVSHAQHHYS